MNAPVLSTSIRETLIGFPQIKLVYLFGSRAGGMIGPMSDTDLAILLDEDASTFVTQANFAHAVADLIGSDKVDVVILNRAPVELAYQVIANGSTIYQKDLATRVEYEAFILSRYGDYLPILREQRSQILQGESNGKRVQRYRETLERTQRAYRSLRTSQGKTSH